MQWKFQKKRGEPTVGEEVVEVISEQNEASRLQGKTAEKIGRDTHPCPTFTFHIGKEGQCLDREAKHQTEHVVRVCGVLDGLGRLLLNTFVHMQEWRVLPNDWRSLLDALWP